MSLGSFFEPKSVAVIGASREPGKLGHEVFKNIIDAGYKGNLYPINPKTDEILGRKCYPSIKDVPSDVELVVVIVPARFVPQVIADCGLKAVRAAIVISGGFKETGEAGKELEQQLLEKAREAGIRIIGPNCQGVNSTTSGLCASWPLITTKGAISVVSQSGTVGAALECWAADEGIGVCKFVALGNKSDVDEIELLEYLADDSNTKVIALYIEGMRDGRKFMEVARDAVRKKPVVVLKGGRTAKGVEAVLSHTRSLAGSDKIFGAAFKQVGIIRAGGVEELYDICKGFTRLPPPKGKNVVVITSSGGAGILAVDACEEMGLNLVNLPEKAHTALEEKLPPVCTLRNPLDLTGSATSQMYDEVLAALGAESEVNSVVMIIGDPMPGITEVILDHFKAGKTIVPVMLGGGSVEVEERAKLQRANVPVYSDPTRAVRALAALARHQLVDKV